MGREALGTAVSVERRSIARRYAAGITGCAACPCPVSSSRRGRRPAVPWASVSAAAKNFEAIVKAKAQHNANCPFPPHAVRMHPFEIERMQWEEGDLIAGLVLEGDSKLGTGEFRLICDGTEPPELELEETEVIGAPVEPIEVPVGPGGPEPGRSTPTA